MTIYKNRQNEYSFAEQELAVAWTKTELVGVSLITLFSFLLRVLSLREAPLFFDEAVHLGLSLEMIKRGVLIVHDPVGKYLSIWIVRVFMPYAQDLVWLGRFVSAVFGTFSVLLTYLLGRKLFGLHAAIVAALVCASVPFLLIVDRLALVDSAMTMFGLGLLFFALRAPSHLPSAVIAGLFLAAAMATKMAAAIYITVPLIVLIASMRRPTLKELGFIEQIFLIGALGLLPTLTNLGSYSFIFAEKSMLDEQVPYAQIWLQNMGRVWEFFTLYYSWPLLLIALVALVVGVIRLDRSLLAVTGMACVFPLFFIISATPGWLFSRYIYPAVPYFALLTGYGLVFLWERVIQLGYAKQVDMGWVTPKRLTAGLYLLLAIFLVPNVSQAFLLISAPDRFEWYELDEWQYRTGYEVAAHEVPDVVAFLQEVMPQEHLSQATVHMVANVPMVKGIELELYPTGVGLFNIQHLPADVTLLTLLNQFQQHSQAPAQYLLIDSSIMQSDDDLSSWSYLREVGRYQYLERPAEMIVLYEADPNWHPE